MDTRQAHVCATQMHLVASAGLPIGPNGRQILDVGDNPTVRERFQAIENALAA